MQKELDPLIDGAVKKIIVNCTELLTSSNREMNKIMTKWHEIQQLNLLPKSELICFVEDQRPSATSSFIGKYCEISSAYYASCAKGFFEELKQQKQKQKEHLQTVLIGDPIEGDLRSKIKRRSSLSLFFSTSKDLNDDSIDYDSIDSVDSEIPFNAANLLIELLKREISFFKEFFGGGSNYLKRRTNLTKIFLKCFSIIKTNLKEKIICENFDSIELLKMMSELTNLEVKVISLNDLSTTTTPMQWLNEIQNLIFEEIKKSIKKQIESLKNYSELKTSLNSSELRHHFVVKRFSNFMKNSLEILKTFKKPWEIIHFELKKLENSFYGWIIKISGYLKDKRESLIFQINNFDLVIQNCSSVAGVEFMTSLKFKFDHLIEKLIKFDHEKYFYDLILITNTTKTKDNIAIIDINDKLLSSFKAVSETFKSSTFTDFSNLKVSEIVLKKFEIETISLYKKYLETCEIEKSVSLHEIENILKTTLTLY